MNKLIRTAKNSGIKAHIERERRGWNKTQEIREGNRKTERKIGRVRTTYGVALTSLGPLVFLWVALGSRSTSACDLQSRGHLGFTVHHSKGWANHSLSPRQDAQLVIIQTE